MINLKNITPPFELTYIWRALAELRKATVDFVLSVCACLSVRLSVHLHGNCTDVLEIWDLNILKNFVQKIQISLKSDNNNGNLHEDLCTFMIISRWIRLRMWNVSDERFRENQNTHSMFNIFLPENSTLGELMWKDMLEPDRPQWQYNTAHALCMLDN
jgi:hypothetical protein